MDQFRLLGLYSLVFPPQPPVLNRVAQSSIAALLKALFHSLPPSPWKTPKAFLQLLAA